MAIPATTLSTYESTGNREDLSDIIYMIDPTDTPLLTSIGETEAKAVLHEWQTISLDSASASNAVLEGDDATTDTANTTTRLSNTCQISDKVARVTGTQRTIVTAGREDELDFQVYLKTLALRRDIDSALSQNNAEVTGDETTARKLGGFETWSYDNASRGTSGSLASATGNSAPVDGTQRAFQESMLKEVLKEGWDNGANFDSVILGSFNKQAASGFTGNATRMVGAEDKQLYASIDVYSSDFGDVEVMLSRQVRTRSALVMQKDMLKCAWLRRVGMTTLAKTGDSDRKQILGEYTLEVCNPKAIGVVADLTTS